METVRPGGAGRQASPPTERVLAIVETLARGAQSMSGLAQELGLSTATVHAILATLTQAGWTERDGSTKQYSVGPALVALAERVRAPHASIQDLLARLATELSMPVSVSTRFGDALMVVHAAAPPGVDAPEIGSHTPYALPFGSVVAAYDDAEARAAWLTRFGTPPPEALSELQVHLDRIRERGFSIERLGPSALRLVEVLQDVRADLSGLDPLMQALVVEIAKTGLSPGPGRQPVSTIVAPLTGSDGRVTRTLNAHPFRSMTPARASEVAHRLIAAADAVGAQAR